MRRKELVCVLLVSWIYVLFLASAAVAQGDWQPGQSGCPTPKPYDCAPRAGTPVPFAGDEGPMRVRKSIWALDDAEIAQLRQAFELFRAMPDTDPIGYQGMANIHCWNCASPASHHGGEVAPEDVHTTWAFLPFHRSYVYALEKILGELVDDPAFALPYWDWDTPDSPDCNGSHKQLPVPYQQRFVSVSDESVNSLWDENRGVGPEDSMCAASVGDDRLDVITTLYDTFPLFFGTDSCGSALWHGAHGYVHVWAGGLINAETDSGPLALSCPDMGMLGTAGRDPLFYSHHANVDRIWDLWIAKNGEPEYPHQFLEQSWNFWMPGPDGLGSERQLVTFTAADGANRSERMRYRYAEPSCDPAAPVRLMPEGVTPLAAGGTSFSIVAKPSYTMNGKTGSKVVLHLDELQTPSNAAGILRVFLDEPGSAEARSCTADSVTQQYLPQYRCAFADNLVEELVIVSRSGIPDPPTKTCIQLVLCPELAKKVVAANGSTSVHIVPVGLNEDGAPAGAPEGVQMSVSRPYFTIQE